MAKISVSIPDELKETLDQYATENDLKRSELVTHILSQYFDTGESEKPEFDFAALAADVQNMKTYLNEIYMLGDFPVPPWIEVNLPERSGLMRQ